MEKVNGTVTLTIDEYEKLINKIHSLEKAFLDSDVLRLELPTGIYSVIPYDDVSQLVFKAYQELQSNVIQQQVRSVSNNDLIMQRHAETFKTLRYKLELMRKFLRDNKIMDKFMDQVFDKYRHDFFDYPDSIR